MKIAVSEKRSERQRTGANIRVTQGLTGVGIGGRLGANPFYFAMPNKHAAIKDLRKSKKRALTNKRIKTNIRALTQQLTALAKEGKKVEATTVAQKLQQTLGKATRENIIHRNNAGRKTASAHKLVGKLK